MKGGKLIQVFSDIHHENSQSIENALEEDAEIIFVAGDIVNFRKSVQKSPDEYLKEYFNKLQAFKRNGALVYPIFGNCDIPNLMFSVINDIQGKRPPSITVEDLIVGFVDWVCEKTREYHPGNVSRDFVLS